MITNNGCQRKGFYPIRNAYAYTYALVFIHFENISAAPPPCSPHLYIIVRGEQEEGTDEISRNE